MSALVFHVNRYGMILHMESLGGMRPQAAGFPAIANCLARTFSEILPDIGENFNSILRLACDSGPSESAFTFGCELVGTAYHIRITYLRKHTALVVIQA